AETTLAAQKWAWDFPVPGVHVVEGCSVEKTHRRGHGHLVHTNLGSIACEYFVNSAGYLGRHVGKMSQPEVKVPLYPCEHQFLHTMPVQGIDPDMPVIHDCDGHFYLRVRGGAYLAGGFEPRGKPVDLKDLGTLPEDWDQFYVLLKEMLFRVPSLANVQVDKLYNCPESFTADSRWIIGEAPEVKNYFVASGMKSVGIEAAGGLGQVTAEWIAKGEPNLDLWDIDIRRFIGTHNNGQFLRDRMTEAPGEPLSPLPSADLQNHFPREKRFPPCHPERRKPLLLSTETSFRTRPFQGRRRKECERGGSEGRWGALSYPAENGFVSRPLTRPMMMQSSAKSRMRMTTPSSQADAPRITTEVRMPPGWDVQTEITGETGLFKNNINHDAKPCKLEFYENITYLIIAPTKQQMRCQTWIRRHVAPDSPIVVADVTSMYTAICIMGQWAPDLMAELTDCPLGAKDFPLFTWKELDIGLASGIKVCHMTHTGDRGWVLYIPNEV
ncbi:unnamed protein product, partial [Ixodes pacificus]